MKSRRKYTKEFKENAVSLVLGGRPAREVSRDLGVDVSNLKRWRKEYLEQMDRSHDGQGQSPSEMAAEIKQLRKELAEQKEVVTILKKTIKSTDSRHGGRISPNRLKERDFPIAPREVVVTDTTYVWSDQGYCYDNAHMESFFGSLKCECRALDQSL